MSRVVTKSATISRLESLLARIRTRAAEPRRDPKPAGILPPTLQVGSSAHPPMPAARGPRMSDPVIKVDFVEDEATIPPPAMPAMATDLDLAIDVEVVSSTPPAPAAVTEEASARRDTSPSRERLAAAAPAPVAVLRRADAVDAAPSIEQVEVVAKVDEDTLVEGEDDSAYEPPASSRRPVAHPPEEQLAELAFGAAEPQPPRHTPPPKSGRLPSPPANEFDADVTGVRPAAEGPGGAEDEPTHRIAATVLVPQAVRPVLEESDVADLIGEAQRFAPSTFLSLLDASLSL